MLRLTSANNASASYEIERKPPFLVCFFLCLRLLANNRDGWFSELRLKNDGQILGFYKVYLIIYRPIYFFSYMEDRHQSLEM